MHLESIIGMEEDRQCILKSSCNQYNSQLHRSHILYYLRLNRWCILQMRDKGCIEICLKDRLQIHLHRGRYCYLALSKKYHIFPCSYQGFMGHKWHSWRGVYMGHNLLLFNRDWEYSQLGSSIRFVCLDLVRFSRYYR